MPDPDLDQNLFEDISTGRGSANAWRAFLKRLKDRADQYEDPLILLAVYLLARIYYGTQEDSSLRDNALARMLGLSRLLERDVKRWEAACVEFNLRKTTTATEARRRTAEALNMSESAVRDAWREHHKLLTALDRNGGPIPRPKVLR